MTDWRSHAAPSLRGPGGRPGPSLPPQRRRPRPFPIIVVLAVVAAAIGLTVKLTASATPQCQASVVPAFFPPQDWGRAAAGGRSPAVLILNPASGPGPAADPVFRPAIAAARGGGTDVIGYVDTSYAQRPLAQAERDVRDYRDWYGVTGIFLDQTPTEGSAQIGYYRALARYIRAAAPDAVIWLNPGDYPNRSYMSVGNVVMAFEGPYENYVSQRVPSWARDYRPTRFAHTVYATPGPDVTNAVRLSRSRNAGYLYLTDDVGPNPYSALPDYWPREQAAVAGGCGAR